MVRIRRGDRAAPEIPFISAFDGFLLRGDTVVADVLFKRLKALLPAA